MAFSLFFFLSFFCFPLQYYFMNLGPLPSLSCCQNSGRFHVKCMSPQSSISFTLLLCIFVMDLRLWFMSLCMFAWLLMSVFCDLFIFFLFKYLRHALSVCWFTTSLCLKLDVFITGKTHIDKINHVSINVNYICAAENYHQYIISVPMWGLCHLYTSITQLSVDWNIMQFISTNQIDKQLKRLFY